VRKTLFIAAGSVAIAIGMLFNSALIRIVAAGKINGLYIAADIVCLLSFCWMGVRAIKIATSPVYAAKERMTIWKIFLGSSLIASQLKNHFAPSPNLFKADNPGESVGMMIASALILLFAGWLIYSGIQDKHKNNLRT
jgi:hypothetical protein